MKKINVLQLIDSLNVGGAEMLAVNTYNLLLENPKINSFLVVSRVEGDLKSKIKNLDSYLFLERKSAIDFFALKKMIQFVDKNNINIIHAHSSSYFLAFCTKIFRPKLRIVWHDHYGFSDNLSVRKKQPLKIISNYFDFGIFVNTKLLQWSKENLNIKKTIFLNNFPHFEESTERTFLKGIEGKRIVCVAALRPQKDHELLLQSFLKVVIKFPDWTLHLIGKIYNDNYFSKLEKFINKNNLKEKVFFYDACLDINFILSQATIGVLSSKSEGLPISLLEYGMAKLPVVVTNVGECENVIKHNYAGLVVEKESPKQFSNAIVQLITSENERKKLGKNNFINVSENYSKEIFIDKLTEIYTSLF